MNKKNLKNSPHGASKTKEKDTKLTKVEERAANRSSKKLSEYGKQLLEKQKVKEIYGMREKQFRRFFTEAVRMVGAPGENLLSLLERRIDNVLYRLKMAVTRRQARQVIVHGHVLVNGRHVYSPSFLVKPGDVIALVANVAGKEKFLEQVIDKRLNIGIKVPEWLELNKNDRQGQVLRMPARVDIQAPVEEHLIVELYSK